MDRPSILHSSKGKLSHLERFQVAAVRRSFDSKTASEVIQWLQMNVGTKWITIATRNLHQVHHLERLPRFERSDSFIVVCNHRSFFDLYVVTCELLKHGIQQRIMFPVRSEFFYDNLLGFAINGAMSFFAMYPPIFRDRKRANLNLIGLNEVCDLLKQGGYVMGFHPEGKRNTESPYQMLPARTGIGRLVHQTRLPVLPVFTNGVDPSDMVAQIKGNFTRRGTPIHTVFGKPIDFGNLLDEPASQSTFKKIANKTRDVLMALGQEEKAIRDGDESSPSTF